MTLSLPAHRPPDPSSDDAASEPPTNGTSAHDAVEDLIPSDLPEAQQELLRTLFGQVDAAADTIGRLRQENRRLRQRVATLEQRPEVADDQTAVLLDDDPDALRSQVDRFIGAIDAYLEGDATQDGTGGDAAGNAADDAAGGGVGSTREDDSSLDDSSLDDA